MGALIIGSAMLLVFGLIWSGVLKSAMDSPLWPYGWLTVWPGLGLMLVAVGLHLMAIVSEQSPVLEIPLLILVASFVLMFWQPRWWGPRWYRERRRGR